LAPIPVDENEVIDADAPIIARTSRGSVREHVAEWAMMRAAEPDLTNKEIATRLGLSRQYLQGLLARAAREGWLKFSDPVSRMDYEIIPTVVDNLKEFLAQKDKAVTIATAQGTIFKTYLEAKGVSDTAKTMLALKIETSPNEHGDVKVIAGQVIGKAREVEN
jgi:transposase